MGTYWADHPEARALFDVAMRSTAIQVRDAVVRAYTFAPLHPVVDVGCQGSCRRQPACASSLVSRAKRARPEHATPRAPDALTIMGEEPAWAEQGAGQRRTTHCP
jgi:hypothetical protein